MKKQLADKIAFAPLPVLILAYDGVGAQPCYRLVGEKVGDAFKAGLALKQAPQAQRLSD